MTTAPALADRLAALPEERRRELARRLRRERRRKEWGDAPFPLSDSQWIMWFVHQLAPRSAAYNAALALRLAAEDLDVEALRRAFARLSRRHPALRTTYRDDDEGPVQKVHEHLPLPLEVVSVAPEGEELLRERLRRACRRPFDLARGPVVRAHLFHRRVHGWVLLLVGHHIALDLWSMGLMVWELRALYRDETGGGAAELPPLEIDYADYVEEQRRLVAGDRGERLWRYWSQRLVDLPEPLELPTDHPRPAVQSFHGDTCELRLGTRATAELRDLARRHGCTLYTLLLAVFQVLLHRYTGRTDVVVGSPVAARTDRDLHRLVGCLINFVVLRGDLSGDPPFAKFLAALYGRVLEALEHQDYPFHVLTERLNLKHDPARPLLAPVAFSYDQALFLPGMEDAGDDGLEVEPLPFLAQQEGQFDLYLEMVLVDGELRGALRYDSALFERDSVERLAESYRTLLAAVVADPGCRLSRLSLLSAAERRRLLEEWNGTEAPYPAARRAHDLIIERCREAPQRPAVACGETRLTYGELEAVSGRVAASLAARGVGPGRVVALLDARGVDLLCAVLGVLRSGAAYLPLDPHHPAARHAAVLRRSGAAFTVAGAGWRRAAEEACAALPAGVQAPPVVDFAALADGVAEQPPIRRAAASDLAYVIFTSGSTGRPKGAMVHHDGMLNHLFAKLGDLGMDGADVVAQSASQCFDISVWQMLAPLCVGGRVEIFPDEVAHDPAQLLAAVMDRGVTVLELVPSLLRLLIEEMESRGTRDDLPLRWMMATGEALPPELVRRWLALVPQVPVVNAYGPTECSDDVTHAVLSQAPPAGAVSVPIGRPVANTRLYVLDRRLEPLPVGGVGELYVGGAGVGRGYLGDPGRTAAVFLPDPYGEGEGLRLYRTGDLARWSRRGDLEYLGRVDHQVKVRGFRIELGEVEAVLGDHPAVGQAVVTVRGAGVGASLAAYLVSRRGGALPQAPELRAWLGERLPDYMVPSVFVELEALPLNASGKVDRKALPEVLPAVEEARYTPPRNDDEALVARVWAEVLGLPRVGADDNFFALGGDSIVSIRIVARLRREGRRVVPQQIFAHPTVAALAQVLGVEKPCDPRPPGDAEEPPVRRLSPMQEAILFHSLVAPGSGMYLIQVRCSLVGDVDGGALAAAWQTVLGRHPVLRSTFHHRGLERPRQRVHRFCSLPFTELDWRCSAEDREERMAAFLEADRERGFDLEDPPLLRLNLIHRGEREAELILTFHHLILDGWSMASVMGEAFERYRGAVEGVEPEVAPVAPYGRYLTWLDRHDDTAAEAFWRGLLAGFVAPTPLPGARNGAGGATGTRQFGERTRRLSEEETGSLVRFARHHLVTVATIARGAWALLLARHAGRREVVFGATVSGRSADLGGVDTMVGVLINTLPVRVALPPEDELVPWLARLQGQESEARSHEHTTLAQIQAWSDVAPGRPLFESNLVFENYPLEELLRWRGAGLEIAGARAHERGSFPLTVMVLPGPEITLAMSFDAERYDSATIDGLLADLADLLVSLPQQPRSRLGEIQALSPAQLRRMEEESGAEVPPPSAAPPPYTPPRNAVEELVAAAWADVLGLPRVGSEDHFFALGGHSLTAIRAVARTAHALGVQVPVRTLFENPTVAAFGDALRRFETRPGQLEATARLRKRVEEMSSEEIRATLQRRRGDASGHQPVTPDGETP